MAVLGMSTGRGAVWFVAAGCGGKLLGRVLLEERRRRSELLGVADWWGQRGEGRLEVQ